MDPSLIIEHYRAYRLLMSAIRSPQNQIALRLEAGQLAVYDNRRVLHGRAAYVPASGYRLLSGFYVARAEWDSRIRRLSQPPES
jgi:gamma-butyrobetaine dioxygenase